MRAGSSTVRLNRTAHHRKAISSPQILSLVGVFSLAFTACGASGGSGSGVTSAADIAAGDVLGCKVQSDCDDGDPCTTDACNAQLGTCISTPIAACASPCDASHACAHGVCDAKAGICVGCAVDGDCAGGWLCDASKCVKALGCGSDLDCKKTDAVCLLPRGVCVQCLTQADCATGSLCEARHCVARQSCASSKECPKICDKVSGFCIACEKSADCGPNAFCDANKQCQPVLCKTGACVNDAYFACKPDGSGFAVSTSCTANAQCTTATCAPVGCVHANKNGPCDDGDACTVAELCEAGACQGKPLVCDDNNLCTADTCAPLIGCKHAPTTFACDDADPCSTGDVCKNATCAGKPVSCDDADACTIDACSAPGGCSHEKATGAACNDGDACSGDDVCISGTCKGTALSCDDGQVCTQDVCNPKSGCAHVPTSGPCDDGDACTEGDACAAGACQAVAKNCDDGVVCTADSCVAVIGCQHKAVDSACDDKNACTDDACDAAKGCSNAPIVAMCDDGNACTTLDACAEGKCVGGSALKCDDKNGCTDDSCKPSSGCVYLANAVTCDDGSACTIFDVCSAKACKGAPKLFDALIEGSVYRNALVSLSDGFAVAGGIAVASAPQVSLTRLDETGKTVWQKKYPGNKESWGEALAATSDGFGIGARDGSKGRLIRTDSEGNKKWELAVGGDNIDTPAGLVATSTGLVWAGTTHLNNGMANGDVRMMRTDDSGGIVWNNVIATYQDEEAQAVIALSDGFVVAAKNDTSGWVARADSAGNVLWSKPCQGTPYGLAAVGDGFLLAGRTQAADQKMHFWLARADGGGAFLWSKPLPGQYAWGQAVVALPDGIAGVGWINGAVGGGGGDDFWLVRTDLVGNLLWSKSIGGPGQDHATALVSFADGFALAGVSSGAALVYRTDAFGSTTCAASGTCAALTPSACDDANPCTADLCNASNVGCYHTNVSDGTVCGVATTCKAGVCSP